MADVPGRKCAMARVLTEDQAREAAMNGQAVRLRNFPPYLRCPLCGGDGSGFHPFLLECAGDHGGGWELGEPAWMRRERPAKVRGGE